MSILKTSVGISTRIEVPRDVVWLELEQIEQHATWMLDAIAIRFLSEQHRGVGTVFECDTKVGPFRLTDVMEITQWDSGHAMSVRHSGAVGGRGTFVLRDDMEHSTTLVWKEDLAFPWWLGSRLGAAVARPIFAALWAGNLRRFQEIVLARGATQ